MAFSGLRSDLSNTLRTLNGSQGQMSLQLVAEMHISPVNGDSVWEKKEEAYWSLPPSTRLPFLLSCTIISPLLTPPPTLSSHPAVTELPPASVISTAAEKLPRIYACGCEGWPVACFACVCEIMSNDFINFFSLRCERSLVLEISWL